MDILVVTQKIATMEEKAEAAKDVAPIVGNALLKLLGVLCDTRKIKRIKRSVTLQDGHKQQVSHLFSFYHTGLLIGCH